MSVLVSDRTESKFEAITYSIELHDMLIDFMQRSFGVKDLDQLVRVRYAHGKDATEDFSRYRYLMLNYKNRIDQLASMLTSNVRAANSIYPTTLHEYEQRRDYQNTAIVAHDRIIYLGMSYIERGWITQDEYENLHDYLYKPYEEMGGNGSAKKVMQEINKLPIHKSTYIQENQ